jgi:serine/threonine protein kinase
MPPHQAPPPDSDSASRPPPPRLREVVLASGLLDESQLAAVEMEVRATGDSSESADPRGWDKTVALECVRKKLLTKFQARELLAGRRRFTLGHYRVLDEIGRGGMGQVFKAEHVMMKRPVAVKVLPLSKANPHTEAAFQREIEMLGRLSHENIVAAHDAGYDGNVYYLVTEYVAGVDLRRQVTRHGPLNQWQAVAVIVQVAHGLAYAHRRGLVHRDVKPGNILVSRDGRVRLLDLGLAGSMFDPESMQMGRRVGTPGYMAPEQIRAPQKVGPAADIFGLGCAFYYALTGQPPFPGTSREEKERRTMAGSPPALRALAPDVDASLAAVVDSMMHSSSSDRIGSAEEVIRRLQPWVSSVPVAMPRGGRGSVPVTHAGQSAPVARSGSGSGLGFDSGSRSDGNALSDTSQDGRSEETLGGPSTVFEHAAAGETASRPWAGRIAHACLMATPLSAAGAVALGVARMVGSGWGPSPFWGGLVVFLVVAGGTLAIPSRGNRGRRP